MYCSQCGTPIHDKSKFCYKCGARVLTVPEPEEGQDAEAGERQSSRGSEGRERRGGRSSEKDPESGADGAGSARAAAPAVKPAPVKVSQAKAPAAKPQKSAAPVKKAQADAPKQLPYEKSAGVIRDLLRMLPRETFDGDDDRLRMLDDGVRICSSVADGSYDGSFFRLALDFTDNIVIRKQDESEAPGRSEHSFTLTFGTDGGGPTPASPRSRTTPSTRRRAGSGCRRSWPASPPGTATTPWTSPWRATERRLPPDHRRQAAEPSKSSIKHP